MEVEDCGVEGVGCLCCRVECILRVVWRAKVVFVLVVLAHVEQIHDGDVADIGDNVDGGERTTRRPRLVIEFIFLSLSREMGSLERLRLGWSDHS